MSDRSDAESPSTRSETPSDFLRVRTRKYELLAELQANATPADPRLLEELLSEWPLDPTSDPDVDKLLNASHRPLSPALPHSIALPFRGPDPSHDGGHAEAGSSTWSRVCFALPKVGDEIFGFRLLRELGSGAFARVFLASQRGLADRPVALKVSDMGGEEAQTLAQLQHTNIVPIFSVHESREAVLRAVCMPFFGGASLSAVLRVLFVEANKPTLGAQLVEALEVAGEPLGTPSVAPEPVSVGSLRPNLPSSPGLIRENPSNPNMLEPTVKVQLDQSKAPAVGEPRRELPAFVPLTEDHSPRKVLKGLSYGEAAAWIVARLAEGLHHAHQRGILHRDIKPANVLLCADGQPMLLDFNLAHDLHAYQNPLALGGTVTYMAPEHLRALLERDPVLAQEVDQRADVYSLGMVLFEMLTGEGPFQHNGSYAPLSNMLAAMADERGRAAPSLRQRQPNAPWGLESIVRKCLAPHPADRYQQAEHLAEDLRRFLEARPLRHAPNLSWQERARNWVRRHPRATSSGVVAVVAVLLLAGAGAAFLGMRGHWRTASEELEVSRSEDRKRAYQEGTLRALMLIIARTDLMDHTAQGRETCEQTLGLYDVLTRDDWQQHPHWKRLAPAEQRKLAEDTRELLLMLANVRVRMAPNDDAVVRGALGLLDKADAIAGLNPSKALWYDRGVYWQLLGDEGKAQEAQKRYDQTPAEQARDYYLWALSLRRGNRDASRRQALAALDAAIRLDPRYYWARFERGLAHLKDGKFQEAAADFGVCVGLWPEYAWGHFNLGYAHAGSGRQEAALQAYDATLERDSNFLDAYLNRGMILLGMQRREQALEDFTKAVTLAPARASLLAGRGVALEGLGRHREADQAFDAAFALLSKATAKERTRVRLGYAFAVVQRLPQKARAAFAAVLSEAPHQPEALYGCALLAAEEGKAEEAVRYLDATLAAAPDLMEAHRHRAIQLARCGRHRDAQKAIDWCLEREPRTGATLYAAACVFARAAEQAKGTPQATAQADKAAGLLKQALEQGVAGDQLRRDPDLKGIHDHPTFRQLAATSHEKKASSH